MARSSIVLCMSASRHNWRRGQACRWTPVLVQPCDWPCSLCHWVSRTASAWRKCRNDFAYSLRRLVDSPGSNSWSSCSHQRPRLLLWFRNSSGGFSGSLCCGIRNRSSSFDHPAMVSRTTFRLMPGWRYCLANASFCSLFYPSFSSSIGCCRSCFWIQVLVSTMCGPFLVMLRGCSLGWAGCCRCSGPSACLPTRWRGSSSFCRCEMDWHACLTECMCYGLFEESAVLPRACSSAPMETASYSRRWQGYPFSSMFDWDYFIVMSISSAFSASITCFPNEEAHHSAFNCSQNQRDALWHSDQID